MLQELAAQSRNFLTEGSEMGGQSHIGRLLKTYLFSKSVKAATWDEIIAYEDAHRFSESGVYHDIAKYIDTFFQAHGKKSSFSPVASLQARGVNSVKYVEDEVSRFVSNPSFNTLSWTLPHFPDLQRQKIVTPARWDKFVVGLVAAVKQSMKEHDAS